MEILALPFAFFACLFALTPAGIMIAAVPALRDRVTNAMANALGGLVVAWTFAVMFAVFIPYGQIDRSASAGIGVSLAVCFCASFFVSGIVLIPFAEQDDPSVYGWLE